MVLWTMAPAPGNRGACCARRLIAVADWLAWGWEVRPDQGSVWFGHGQRADQRQRLPRPTVATAEEFLRLLKSLPLSRPFAPEDGLVGERRAEDDSSSIFFGNIRRVWQLQRTRQKHEKGVRLRGCTPYATHKSSIVPTRLPFRSHPFLATTPAPASGEPVTRLLLQRLSARRRSSATQPRRRSKGAKKRVKRRQASKVATRGSAAAGAVAEAWPGVEPIISKVRRPHDGLSMGQAD
jgi:hypothetical protein